MFPFRTLRLMSMLWSHTCMRMVIGSLKYGNPVSAFAHSLMVCANIQLGWTPLHFVSHSGHRDCAALLLGGKADPNHRDEVNRGARVVLGPVFGVRFRAWGVCVCVCVCVCERERERDPPLSLTIVIIIEILLVSMPIP